MRLLIFVCLLLCNTLQGHFDASNLSGVPSAYKGRFRPLEASSRLWLYDLYHAESVNSNMSANDLLWDIHFNGHASWDNTPLFWIGNKEIKANLGLDPKESHFSFSQLHEAIYLNEESNLRFLQPLLLHTFVTSYYDSANRSKSDKRELSHLASGLWVMRKNDQIEILSVPENEPWHFLKPGDTLSKDLQTATKTRLHKKYSDDSLQLLQQLIQYMQWAPSQLNDTFSLALKNLQQQGLAPQAITMQLESQFPLAQRRAQSDSLLKLLPSKRSGGDWLPLKALKLKTYDPSNNALHPISNFTPYSDEQFNKIRTTYLALEAAVADQENTLIAHHSQNLATALNVGYQGIAGTVFKSTSGKSIHYPSTLQLQMEKRYYQFPLTPLILFLYICASIMLCMGLQRINWTTWGVRTLGVGFFLHTLLIAMRCYILARPPVSNMFETVIYVPWISLALAFLFFAFFRNSLILLIATVASIILLAVLQVTHLNGHLDNVQAVLDSQYWLIVHVLLVVGSYGVFILAGLMAHVFLIMLAYQRKLSENLHFLAQCILQAMYIGIAMLVPGTILGGVWAAESWGRFWDWDPKESWAFISICTYLVIVHAHRFHRIGNIGLAIGAIVGLLAISFTWYGVNYILGTGLHSYGFGSGGEFFYYLFLLTDIFFVISIKTWITLRGIEKSI
ncbi:MAG: cytochrome c biogenesis protein CcsA [Parachlamydiaceae bacterium]|nr:cytochrome c biogenesis protein CcsA [Parachlamydiaceae bacterium]